MWVTPCGQLPPEPLSSSIVLYQRFVPKGNSFVHDPSSSHVHDQPSQSYHYHHPHNHNHCYDDYYYYCCDHMHTPRCTQEAPQALFRFRTQNTQCPPRWASKELGTCCHPKPAHLSKMSENSLLILPPPSSLHPPPCSPLPLLSPSLIPPPSSLLSKGRAIRK